LGLPESCQNTIIAIWVTIVGILACPVFNKPPQSNTSLTVSMSYALHFKPSKIGKEVAFSKEYQEGRGNEA
jgi:hypothetical protein